MNSVRRWNYLFSSGERNFKARFEARTTASCQYSPELCAGTGAAKRQVLMPAIFRMRWSARLDKCEFSRKDSPGEHPQPGAFCKWQIRHRTYALSCRWVNSGRADLWISRRKPRQISDYDGSLHGARRVANRI